MLLLLIIILVLIWAAVVWSIYSNFLTFYSNFSETENYHKAYYAAISALERGELVVKQRSPWYEWKAWRYRNWNSRTWTWSIKIPNWKSDWVISADSFSYLSNNNRPSEMIRSVDSRAETGIIPEPWKWNVEFLLRNPDSKNYNIMWYEDAEVFLLYYDVWDWNPYARIKCLLWDGWCSNSSLGTSSSIKWKIRLPQKLLLSGNFTLLDTTAILVWTNNQLPKDDAIVDRQLRWTYTITTTEGDKSVPYTIYSTQKTENNNKTVSYLYDTIFRESDINGTWDFEFTNNWNPLKPKNPLYHWKQKPVTIISQGENTIKSLNGFQQLLWTIGKSSRNQLRFSLLNIVRDSNLKIYPFLEYQIDFWTTVSDRYYTINGKWSFSDFEVNIPRQKPTVKETVLWNFTSIF